VGGTGSFFVNVPIGLLTGLFAVRLVGDSHWTGWNFRIAWSMFARQTSPVPRRASTVRAGYSTVAGVLVGWLFQRLPGSARRGQIQACGRRGDPNWSTRLMPPQWRRRGCGPLCSSTAYPLDVRRCRTSSRRE
jgi:hypothetical protein